MGWSRPRSETCQLSPVEPGETFDHHCQVCQYWAELFHPARTSGLGLYPLALQSSLVLGD